MQQDEPQFDEPALKAAIRRTSAEETAPAGLRERIAKQMASERGGADGGRAVSARPRRMTIERVKMLIAASVAIVAVGVAAYQVRETYFPPGRAIQAYKQDLPTEFAEAMVRVHDTNAGMAAPTSAAATQLTTLKEKLSKDVGIPVIVSADLGDGWVMKSSGETVIQKSKAAYVTYAKSGQTVTVFSISAYGAYQAPDGAEYAQTVNGHGLSGFRDGNGLYCVVGSATAGAPSLDELNKLRDSLHTCLPPRSCGGNGEQSLARGMEKAGN
jgi:hypothetical protein